jgi:AcrR family transcriptional regulator
MHPTKGLLQETAINLIDEFGPQGFTVETLLETSKISKGSLYHHYHDFSDVIEQAQVARFSRYVDEDIMLLVGLLKSATSREDLESKFAMIVQGAGLPGRDASRADRAAILGMARHSKKLADGLAVEQQRVTDVLADIAREMQERGWINKELDAAVVATFVQAYSMGFVLNDITASPISIERWSSFISFMLGKIFELSAS